MAMKTDQLTGSNPGSEGTAGSTPLGERYFEDYVVGEVLEFGSVTLEEADMIAFARRFDPQPFHTDPEAGKKSIYGGLIASGWYTASQAMRLLVDHYVSRKASLGSPGVEELRWLKPVRPGDTLSLRVTVLDVQRSQSKPDQGAIRVFVETRNQHHEVVMTSKSVGLVRCRKRLGASKE